MGANWIVPTQMDETESPLLSWNELIVSGADGAVKVVE